MAHPEPAASSNHTSDGFGSTSWSLVIEAGRETGGEALERLCQKHWRPIYIFVRRSGLSSADAEDVTQDFFVELLGRNWLGKADPARGSFRAFLLTLVTNFLANWRRSARAERRGGRAVILSFNQAEGERELSRLTSPDADPVKAYQSSWAQGVLAAAWERLDREQAEAGTGAVFAMLRDFVLQSPPAGEYRRLSERLGMRQGHVALTVHRLNRRFTELVRAEVADTLVDRSELEAELRVLLGAIER